MEWKLCDSWGISVTDETLERALRVKRLIGRPLKSAQPERKSTLRYDGGIIAKEVLKNEDSFIQRIYSKNKRIRVITQIRLLIS